MKKRIFVNTAHLRDNRKRERRLRNVFKVEVGEDTYSARAVQIEGESWAVYMKGHAPAEAWIETKGPVLLVIDDSTTKRIE